MTRTATSGPCSAASAWVSSSWCAANAACAGPSSAISVTRTRSAPRAWAIKSGGKWGQPDAQNITNGVRIKTYDNGAAADSDLLVEIY